MVGRWPRICQEVVEGMPCDGGVVFQEREPLCLGAPPVLCGFLTVQHVPPQRSLLRLDPPLFLQLSEAQQLLHDIGVSQWWDWEWVALSLIDGLMTGPALGGMSGAVEV